MVSVVARGNVLRLTCAFLFTGDTKEVVTASLDKSLALWRLQVHFQKSLVSLQLVVRLTFASWLVLCRLLTFTFIGNALQDASLPDATPSTSGVSEVVRLSPDVAPIFSLVADSHALGDSHNQVFCGNLAKSIEAWEPPDSELIPKVHLNSHTGWVRGLATSRRWLFR